MSFQRSKDSLNQRLGEAVFLSAIKGFSGDSARPSVEKFAVILSLVILIVPWITVGVGLALLWFGWPNILVVCLAFLLLGFAWLIRPRRAKIPKNGFEHENLPRLFEMLYSVGTAMGAPKIDKVFWDLTDNASVSRIRGKNTLHIGVLLWRRISPNQKVALIAHELAHLVNSDPSRRGLQAQALHLLECWEQIVTPEWVRDWQTGEIYRERHGLLADAMMATSRFFIELLYSGLMYLTFFSSQRAEYLADGLAVGVSGKAASKELLEALAVSDALNLVINGVTPKPQETGSSFLARIINQFECLPSEKLHAFRTAHMDEKLTISGTHPPTVYRLAFIDTLPDHHHTEIEIDWLEIEKELFQIFENLGQKLMVDLEVQ